MTTITRGFGFDHRMVRKYTFSDVSLTHKPYPLRHRMLDPYGPYPRARRAEGCRTGSWLYHEIVAHGYEGGKTQIADFAAKLRREECRQTP